MHMPAADRELEEALESTVLEVPRPGAEPGAGQEPVYGFGPNPGDRRFQPDGAAEGPKDIFGGVAPVTQRPAEGHIMRHQVSDVHRSPSRGKSATVRRAARSTLA